MNAVLLLPRLVPMLRSIVEVNLALLILDQLHVQKPQLDVLLLYVVLLMLVLLILPLVVLVIMLILLIVVMSPVDLVVR